MKPVRRVKNYLLPALRKNDAITFRTILDHQGWPQNSKWSDYELLLKAIKNNSKRVAWVLLEKGARIFKRKRVNSPLHEVASKVGWTDFVKVLLDRGANVADLNNENESALHIAFVNQKSMELVDLLLKAHLRDTTTSVVDFVNKDGLSFLHIACARPNLKFVSVLIERGQVDVDIQVSVISNSAFAGYTPLHFAVKFSQYDVVELLLTRYGVDIYEQDANGSTPLHIATEHGDVQMIDLILRYDDLREDCYNRFGLSHFMAACAGSDESLVKDYFEVAAYRSWTEPDTMVRSQVENQRNDPNAGYTPLHFAAQYGRFNTAKLLLQYGARCCSTAFNNVTPLELACKRDHVDVYGLLVDCCRDVGRQPPAKKRRIFGNQSRVNVEFVDFNDDLRKRKVRAGSLDSNESTLSSSSVASAGPFSFDSRTIYVNPRQIFEHGNEMFFYFYDDINDCSVGFESEHSICNQVGSEMDYPSIEIPKDFESDFNEPLDDVFSDDNLQAFDKKPGYDCSSSGISKKIDASIEELSGNSLPNDAGEIVQLSSFDEQMIFDGLFEEYLKNAKPQDDLTDEEFEFVKSFDEHMKCDELMYKFLKDAQLSISKQDDFDSSFVNSFEYPTANSSTLEHETTGFITADDLDTTLEVTSSSSESDILEEDSKNSCFSDDDASTVDMMSSSYETDSSIPGENICRDRKAHSSAEKDVEVVFVGVEKFYEDSLENVADCDVEEYQSDKSNCSDTQEDSASQVVDLWHSFVSDLSSKFQPPVTSLNPFQFPKPCEQRQKILDFSHY